MRMTGSVKSADRQRWSCKSSLTSCRTHSDSKGAPLHSLDLLKHSASTVPFSVSLCFRGAWKDGGKLGKRFCVHTTSKFNTIKLRILPDSTCDSKIFRSSVASVPERAVEKQTQMCVCVNYEVMKGLHLN